MNYSKHYQLLTSSRQSLYTLRTEDKKQGIYYEKHHIVPRSMGGANNKENLVWLTAREHFVAHWLLWKIHRNKQMAYAFYSFSANRYNKRKLTSYQYEVLRNMRSVAFSGENSPRGFLGKNHTETAKDRMKKSKQGANNPMYGLGSNHPNCKRTGKNNPMYGKSPWLNPSVINNKKQLYLWSIRNILYSLWIEQKSPSWYKFGASLTIRQPGHDLYNPYDFRNIVKWFRKRDTNAAC